MLSLFLLSVLAMFILPVYIKVQQERVVIKQQQEALLILEDYVLDYIHTGNFQELNHSLYNLERTDLPDNSTQFCLNWKGASLKNQKSCLYAKK